MVIDNKILDDLSAQAKANPRLRQAMDLRNSPEDLSQRMLNALEPGTVMPKVPRGQVSGMRKRQSCNFLF